MKMTTMHEPFDWGEITELMTPEQAADFLAVKPRTLVNWRWRGCGPAFVRVGDRDVRYTKPDLIAYLKGRRFRSTSEESASS